MKDNIITVIPARVHSTRLLEKMLRPLYGNVSLLEAVYERAKGLPNPVVSMCAGDVWAFERRGLPLHVYVGDPNDVLGRIAHCAYQAKAAHVVRINADSPCLDAHEVEWLIEHCHQYPFASNTHNMFNHRTGEWSQYPDGIGAELYRMDYLDHLHETVTHPMLREHPHLNPMRMNIVETVQCSAPLAYPHLRLDIDTEADLEFMRRVFEGQDALTPTRILVERAQGLTSK